jgi:bisphosphoglycerate-dependent phosphoglycerate mutase
MPAPGTLLLLRHGQSVLNAQDRFTGLLDPPLTRAGENEATEAGALLASVSYFSDAVTPPLCPAPGTPPASSWTCWEARTCR